MLENLIRTERKLASGLNLRWWFTSQNIGAIFCLDTHWVREPLLIHLIMFFDTSNNHNLINFAKALIRLLLQYWVLIFHWFRIVLFSCNKNVWNNPDKSQSMDISYWNLTIGWVWIKISNFRNIIAWYFTSSDYSYVSYLVGTSK